MRLVYSLAYYCIIPIVICRLIWRSVKEPAYRHNLSQRFGYIPNQAERPIWIHSVSAGETIAAVPLIKKLLALGHPIVVTTMTATGRERVQALLGSQVVHFYAPYDLPGVLQRFIARVRPKGYVVVDTELWPNTVHYLNKNNIPCYLVNGRLSEKSARGYRRIAGLSRPMLNSFDRLCVQTRAHESRFLGLGVAQSRLEVTGSIKFDAIQPADIKVRREALGRCFDARSVFLAASTHAGEEQLILQAYQSVLAELQVESGPVTRAKDLLIIAPRHPHRADEVYALCCSRGLKVLRHSEALQQKITRCPPDIDVYLLDVMGQLLYFYSIAEIALVAGSLVDRGGHNPMEPASLGIPMLMGKYRRNIDDIAQHFVEAGAMLLVQDADHLAELWRDLSDNIDRRRSMSIAAVAVMANNRGALKQVLAVIDNGVGGHTDKLDARPGG
ncbi:MAG: 3-deoxy-D-manno-octulosonic acid transferase [Pseudomonadales bacterium]|nr:3-deoxy-D-manno-octulosonic acid transferase [Pseudomonadales bacterium]